MFNPREFALNNGLKAEEYDLICKDLGRVPSKEEIGIFSALWSEHCGYKHSYNLLKMLPKEGENVLAGPGENAGAILINDENVVVFKMESHNHPSAVAPFHGAATGVGGILRDVFTMGARPIAILDSLHFGPMNNLKNRFLKEKVIEGISFYGNCVGVPTVGGEFDIDDSYCELPLVNVMAVGICKKDELIFTNTGKKDALVVAFGAKTGRDGVHGAIFASDTEYDDIGAIQIADPFFEKLLIEACREIAKENIVLAMQDMGAAGLTSSSAEMAFKSGCGVELNLDRLHIRDSSLTPYDMLLSETQERMLAIIEESNLEKLTKILNKWDIEYTVIGKLTSDMRFKVTYKNKTVADIPLILLEEKIPRYSIETSGYKTKSHQSSSIDFDKLLKSFPDFLDFITKDYADIYERYDYMVGNQTILGPGHSAAVIWIPGTNSALALTTDSNKLYSYLDAYNASKIILSEGIRNLVSVGAEPIGITNCLNFGRPEEPTVFEDFKQTIFGLRDAAQFFKLPVVSGNVSFYNENTKNRIKPTPVFGIVGLVPDIKKVVSTNFKSDSGLLYEIGENLMEFSGSMVQLFLTKNVSGDIPKIDLEREKKVAQIIKNLVSEEFVVTVNDISSGGILRAALNSLALSNKNFGIKFNFSFNSDALVYITSESQARYLVEVPQSKENAFVSRLKSEGIKFKCIGQLIEEPKIWFKDGTYFKRT